jgi:bromodomain adjacent to zinc finger domain protein 1A
MFYCSQEEMASLLEDIKEENPASNNSTEEDIVMQDCSELSDISEIGSESTSAAVGKKSARQKDLRIKTQTIAHSKEREAARVKQAAQKQAMAEHRRVDEEVNKIERRLEGIEREFRRLLGGVRVKPLGRDRFFNRIWWFDGMGSALVGSGGTALYGSGRLFIQGPSEFDDDILSKKQYIDKEDIESRRLEEEGKDGILGPNEWAVYNDLDEVCFISLLFR